jgi:hypothetical protein
MNSSDLEFVLRVNELFDVLELIICKKSMLIRHYFRGLYLW